MLIFKNVIIFENHLILKYRICYSNLRLNFIKRNNQQPASVCDLQRYDYDVTSELWSHKSE